MRTIVIAAAALAAVFAAPAYADDSGAAAGVVGSQQISVNTQQHEKGTGSGGKGPSGGAGGPNRTEKGRTMPAGL